MKRFLLMVLPLCTFLSCDQLKVKTRPPVPLDKMEKVLLDIYLAEVYSTMINDSMRMSYSKDLDSLGVFYKDVLSHHGLSREEFHKGIEWYQKNPAEMDSSYKRMVTEMGKIESLNTK